MGNDIDTMFLLYVIRRRWKRLERKFMIQVWVPGLGREFEFVLPDSMRIHQLVKLMAKILMEEYPGSNAQSQELRLVEKQTLLALHPRNTVAESGMADGKEYMLM